MKNSILIKILLCLCCVFFIGIACTSSISREKKPSKDTSKQDSIALWIKASKNKKVQEQHQYYLEELQDIEKEIRDVSHQLNTYTTNTDINFSNLIAQLLQDKSILGNFKYELTLSEQISWKTVNELVKVNLYRIIQESLQNIIKHANASQVLLAFSKEQEHLVVELTDNGIGFNSNKTTKGIGLKNAHSRIQKLNGKFHLSSVKNQGTSIHIQLPITITI